MGISSRIPLPNPDHVNDVFKDVFDYLQQIKQRKIQQEQFAQQFGLQKQAAQRAQELQPLEMQKYQQEINKNKQEQEANQKFLDMLRNGGKNQIPVSQPSSTSTSLTNNFADMQKKLDSGEEVLIRSPQPGKEGWDNFAGQTRMGIKIPDIKTRIVDGIREDVYPSGKIVRQKVGLTPEEKAKVQLDVAEQKEQAKSDVKYKEDTDNYFKNLATFADNNEAIANIMKRNPGVTGIFSAGKKYFKLGTKDAGAFQRLSVPMVGDLAKSLSTRGGAVALNYASGGKYDLSQSTDYNQGILEQTNNAIIRDYNREAENYKRRTGKEPPYKLPQYYRNWEKFSQAQKMADDAIARGADPQKVDERLTQIKNNLGI